MSSSLLAAGLSCFAVGVALDVVLGVRRSAIRQLPYLLAIAGSGSDVATVPRSAARQASITGPSLMTAGTPRW